MEGQRMDNLIQRLGNAIDGVISGFDRIVLKGFLQPLMFPEGALSFLRSKHVLNKDYRDWMQQESKALIDAVESAIQEKTGRGILVIPSSAERKETLAHRQQQDLGIDRGVIGAWSCVEAGQSYRACFDRDKGFPQLRWEPIRCKHIYVYHDHADYGFLNLRIQTWFPYQIQVCMNGREWLRRRLDRAHVSYERCGNKFLSIDNMRTAQRFLNDQPLIDWPHLLKLLVPTIFPTKNRTIGKGMEYHWTVWQSEWATDLICRDASFAQTTMESLLSHALITGTSERVLRYLARPMTKAGNPYASSTSEVQTRVIAYQDGMRIRHWVGKNSAKVYNEQNVVRFEATINDPSAFKIMRRKQGASRTAKQERLAMRRGVADIAARAAISQGINNRFMDHVATFSDATPMADLYSKYTTSFTKNGRRIRALEPIGKDRELLLAIGDQKHGIAGVTNAELRAMLADKAWAKGCSQEQLSARISRHLSLLRSHGLIRKMPNQNRYQLTAAGRLLATALSATLKASTKELIGIAG
jgi:hypothetical protein